jgi:2-C-methyl-D-erythritol 4-phosphate cytidylyltransferase
VPGPSPRVGVIVPAAGDGRRLGRQSAKALVGLGEQPLLAWALAAVEANHCVDSVVVVTHPLTADAVSELVAARGFARVAAVVPGGPTRRASVAAGLAALPAGPAYVAVHDACRPLLPAGAIDRLLEALRGMEGRYGVVPGAPVTDTVRRVAAGGRSGGIVDREELRAIQTPQLYLRAALEEAHRQASSGGQSGSGQAADETGRAAGTREAGGVGEAGELDDAVLVERAGYPVAVVPGELENLKITTPVDLLAAEALLARTARTAQTALGRQTTRIGQATQGGAQR